MAINNQHDKKNTMKRKADSVKLGAKDIKKQRRSSRPHADMVQRGKQLWDKVRVKKMASADRAKLINEMMELFDGKMFEIASKHDASRMIQSLLQYGNATQRSSVINELKEHMVDMSKLQYGHFLVQKMIRYGSSADRAEMVKQMTGHMVKLGTHSVAAGVIEYAQEWFKPSQLSALQLEFYGKEFIYFKLQDVKNLAGVLEHSPKKKEVILNTVARTLNKMIEKELLGMAYVQKLLWEYMSVASYDRLTNMIPNLRDAALALVSTKYGSQVVCKCLAYGTAKDRKRIIKAFKGKVVDACNHPSGYLAIMTLLNVVDDTVSVQKMILSEMLPAMADITVHPNGSKIVLQLLSPNSKTYLSAHELALMEPPKIPSSENPEELVVNYKKEPEVRRSELLKGLQVPLEQVCSSDTMNLLKSATGAPVVVETLREWNNAALKEGLIEAIVEGSKSDKIFEHPIAHKSIRRLVDVDGFGSPLLDEIKDQIGEWAKSNRGSFGLLSILKKCPETTEKVREGLTNVMDALEEASKEQAGTKLLLSTLNP